MREIIGYRFHPTDKEIVLHYLNNRILRNDSVLKGLISELNAYEFEPWELPSLVKKLPNGDVSYLYSPLGRKSSRTMRVNRCTKAGFWKGTGRDRRIKDGDRIIGYKKTLVFHIRGASRDEKAKPTGWIMHEYLSVLEPPSQVSIVFCKIKYKFKKPSASDGSEGTASLTPQSEDHATIAVTREDHQIQETTEHTTNYEESDNFSPSEQLTVDGLQNQSGFNVNQNIHQPILEAPESFPMSGGFEGLAAPVGLLADDMGGLNEFSNQNVINQAQEPSEPLASDEFAVLLESFLRDVLDSYEPNNSQIMPQPLQQRENEPFLAGTQSPAWFSNNQNMVQSTFNWDSVDSEFLNGPQEAGQRFVCSEFSEPDASYFHTSRHVITLPKSVPGVFVESDSDSDTDAESIDARSYQAPPSPTHSDSSSIEQGKFHMDGLKGDETQPFHINPGDSSSNTETCKYQYKQDFVENVTQEFQSRFPLRAVSGDPAGGAADTDTVSHLSEEHYDQKSEWKMVYDPNEKAAANLEPCKWTANKNKQEHLCVSPKINYKPNVAWFSILTAVAGMLLSYSVARGVLHLFTD